jgi:hypothetical protein
MQSRSIRRSGQPTRATASRMRAFDRDLIRGGHYGQRSCEPHKQAEHMAKPTSKANFPCQPGAVHTWHLADLQRRPAECLLPGAGADEPDCPAESAHDPNRKCVAQASFVWIGQVRRQDTDRKEPTLGQSRSGCLAFGTERRPLPSSSTASALAVLHLYWRQDWANDLPAHKMTGNEKTIPHDGESHAQSI